jgi:hypothetical protein
MNRNNVVINFFVTEYEEGTGKFIRTHHDHWIGKEKHVQPHLRNSLAHQHKATKKKYRYKKKGTGGYGK